MPHAPPRRRPGRRRGRRGAGRLGAAAAGRRGERGPARRPRRAAALAAAALAAAAAAVVLGPFKVLVSIAGLGQPLVVRAPEVARPARVLGRANAPAPRAAAAAARAGRAAGRVAEDAVAAAVVSWIRCKLADRILVGAGVLREPLLNLPQREEEALPPVLR